MRKPLLSILAVLALAAHLIPARADEPIYIGADETEALEAKEGQEVVVHGTTTGSGKSSSGTNFVNFDGAEFYLVTFKSDLTRFPDGEPSNAYDGKRLAVTGVISIYQGKPQIKLTSPGQVRVLEESEEFPPKREMVETEAPAESAEPEEESAKKEEPTEEKPGKRKPPVDPSKYFD